MGVFKAVVDELQKEAALAYARLSHNDVLENVLVAYRPARSLHL